MKDQTESPRIFTINSRKFDGEIHRSWHVELLSSKNGLYEFHGVFDFDVDHSELGLIEKGTRSFEYYWKNKGYNVFQFFEPGGNFRNFYCNIIMPPNFGDRVVDYVDLDIDVLVSEDFTVKILDLDEFEINARKFGYSDELRKDVDEDLATLFALIDRRDFPFDI